MTSRPRQWLDYFLLRVLYMVALPLPRVALLAVGRCLGDFVWYVVRYRRQVVLAHITDSFVGEKSAREIRLIAHAFYRNLGMTLMEFLSFPRLNRERVLALVELEGVEHLEALQRAGRGGLIVSGHYGNWELLGAVVAAVGGKINCLVKTQSNARVDRLQNEIRSRVGVGAIRADSGIRDMVRALRRNEFIGLIGDQDAGGDGLFTEFLGRPASVFKGTAYFAWKLKVPVITVFVRRLPDGRHRVCFEASFSADPAWDEETAVRRLTEIHVQRLAAAVRMAPEQYFWLHRRWKTRPPEEVL